MPAEVIEQPSRTRQRGPAWPVAGTLLAVIVLDQVSKAWGWRHAGRVHVNSGGNMLVSDSVSAWLRNPVLGAAFDVVDTVALAVALLLLVRRPRAPLALASFTLILAGCASNLADRLGLHELTAPGSRRGVVDYLHFWGRLWNVADLAILAGAGLLLPALLSHCARHRVDSGVGSAAPVRNPLGSRVGRRIVGTVLAGTAALAAVGAVNCAGADGPHPVAVHRSHNAPARR